MTSLLPIPRWARTATAAVVVFAVSACADSPTAPSGSSSQASPSSDAVQFNEALATVAWNEVARGLTNKYPTSQQGGTRLFAYLSLAQYDAVIAAEDGKDNGEHPSPAAAVAGASAAVLAAQYPAEAAALDALVLAQANAPTWPGDAQKSFAAGEAIGRAIGQQILTSAAGDGFTSAQGGTIPVCPGCWFSATPPVFPRLAEMRPFSPDDREPVPTAPTAGVRVAGVSRRACGGSADRRHAHGGADRDREVLGAAGWLHRGSGLQQPGRDGSHHRVSSR